MTPEAKSLLSIVIANLILLAVGIAGSAVAKQDIRAWLAFGIGGIAIVTFFGLLVLQMSLPKDRRSFRGPIAGSIVLVYLILVVTFSFFMMREYVPGSVQVVEQELPPMTRTLMISFTAVVGTVIAFYFGSSAVDAIVRRQPGGANGGGD